MHLFSLTTNQAGMRINLVLRFHMIKPGVKCRLKMGDHLLEDFINLNLLSLMSRPLDTSPTAPTAVQLNLWSKPWENKKLTTGGVLVKKFHYVVADTIVIHL